MSEFEKWFMDQDFYTNMRFIHGDALFTKDDDVYRVLPVQMTHVAWVRRSKPILGKLFNFDLLDSLKAEIEKLKAEKVGLEKLIKEWREESKELCRVDDKYVIGALLSCAERLEEAVRGEHE